MLSGPQSQLQGVLAPQGPIARAERLILFDSTAIMLAIVVPAIIATIAFAWWFRSGNAKAKYRPDWAFSGRLEVIVWSIPAMVVLFLGGIGWIGAHDLDPYKPIASGQKPIEVQVVSLDWKWLFIYPDQGVASVNHLVVPAGAPIHFSLTSATVMNSFFIPQLGSQIYAMAGMTTELSLEADHPGSYRGLSAMFSGDGFSDMTFDADAVPPEDFAKWVDGAKEAGPVLDRDGYATLARESKAVKPFSYRSVAPGLFHRIVTLRAADAPGPSEGKPGADVKPMTPGL
jgi:cytochrome o ubiquinol oxidase subunit 2